MKRKIAEVWETDNYSLFHHIDGNRDVRDNRCKRIGKSFDDNGRVLNPIFVDESFGIIDGQGRFEASKERGMTIQFIQSPTYDLKACVTLNKYNTNWSLSDYVNSYAQTGSVDYKFIQILMSEYSYLGVSTVMNAINPDRFFANQEGLKDGTEKCSSVQYERAIKKLKYEAQFLEAANEIGGKRGSFLMAIGFAYDHSDIDNEKLIKKVNAFNQFKPISDIDDAIKQLESAYNKNERNKVFFVSDFKRFVAKRGKGRNDLEKGRHDRKKLYAKDHYYNDARLR